MKQHGRQPHQLAACLGLLVLLLSCGHAPAQTNTEGAAAGGQAAPRQQAEQGQRDAQPAPAPAPAPNAGDISLLELIVKGGIFMVPIGLASLLALGIIFERFLTLRYGSILPRSFMPGLKRVARDREAALQYCRDHDSPIARIIGAGIRKSHQGEERMERALEEAGGKEISKLRRNLRMLYGISVAAPMMGLVGTVWGMIESFRVTASGGGIGKPELLAKGIYEALVATLFGLLIAIPALLIYYYFAGKIDKIVHDLNDSAQQFMDEFGPPPGERRPAQAAAAAARPAPGTAPSPAPKIKVERQQPSEA